MAGAGRRFEHLFGFLYDVIRWIEPRGRRSGHVFHRRCTRGGVHRHLRPLELSGAVPAAGAALKLEDGSEAGCITSAAELKLASGSRTFALAMLRSQAEKPGLALNYSEGTARILDTPPNFKFKA